MDLLVEISPEEERIVQSARARGINNVEKEVRNTIQQLESRVSEPANTGAEDPTVALLRKWREEDATDDPEELDRRDRENAEFFASLKANRVNFRIPNI